MAQFGPDEVGGNPGNRRPAPGLSPVVPEDAEVLSRMAWDIWHRHYHPDILSLPAIRHLWARSYRPDLITADISRGTVYRWIEREHRRVGFVSWRPDTAEDRLWLSKLYVLPECHGAGLGAYALECAATAARELALGEIRLYVFKKNLRAIRAYQRAGFRVIQAEVSDAGNGYVYDDYVMSKRIAPVSTPGGAHSSGAR